MLNKRSSTESRKMRHGRNRRTLSGNAERPRMTVFISNRQAYAQIVDDDKGATLCSASTLSKELKEQVKGKPMTETAAILGKAIAEKAVSAGITKIVFDRSGYKYGKRLKALCDAAREAGLVF